MINFIIIIIIIHKTESFNLEICCVTPFDDNCLCQTVLTDYFVWCNSCLLYFVLSRVICLLLTLLVANSYNSRNQFVKISFHKQNCLFVAKINKQVQRRFFNLIISIFCRVIYYLETFNHKTSGSFVIRRLS